MNCPKCVNNDANVCFYNVEIILKQKNFSKQKKFKTLFWEKIYFLKRFIKNKCPVLYVLYCTPRVGVLTGTNTLARRSGR